MCVVYRLIIYTCLIELLVSNPVLCVAGSVRFVSLQNRSTVSLYNKNKKVVRKGGGTCCVCVCVYIKTLPSANKKEKNRPRTLAVRVWSRLVYRKTIIHLFSVLYITSFLLCGRLLLACCCARAVQSSRPFSSPSPFFYSFFF